MNMGFAENASKRACLAVDNKSAEEAIMWILGNQDNPDINKAPE